MVIGAMLAASPAFAGWFGYANYDDCMLDKMKGQIAAMYRSANKECARQFKVEQKVSSADTHFVVQPTTDGVTVTEDKNTSEFIITRVELEFHFSKDCFMAQSQEMSHSVTVTMKGGKGSLTSYIHKAKCIEVSQAWGIYR